MPSARYRLFDFGTLYLTKAQREAPALIVGVEVLNYRVPPYESGKRLPPQGVWAYVTQRWQDFVDGPEMEVRFRKQRHVLWNDTTPTIQTGACTSTNALYSAIMTELAKKPNTPPLPPSLPPVLPLIQNSARSVLLRPGAISIKSVYQSDMDVYLWWTDAPDDGADTCKTPPLPDPPTPPVEPSLPVPSGAWAGPQFPLPPSLPAGSPPIGGGSLNQGGGFAGDQSIPVSNFTQTTLRASYAVAGFASEGCAPRAPRLAAFGPFPGILPASALTFVNRPGFPQSGFSCGGSDYTFDVFGPTGILVSGETYIGVSGPVSISPIYS
jgi:hypothetical protein